MPHYSQENHISTLLEALNPVRDAVQNWGIDVAQYLETYLEQIASESVANFREAALLIQNSTVIYVKKVDYLWIITQQLVDNLRRQRYEEEKQKESHHPSNTTEATAEQAADNAAENVPKKRKHKEDKTKYIEISIEISEKLLELEPSKENRQPWKFLPDVYHQFQKRPLSNKKRVIYGPGGEEQETRNYKCNSVLLPSMMLHHEFKNESTVPFTCGVHLAAEDDVTEEAAVAGWVPSSTEYITDTDLDHPPSPLGANSEGSSGPVPDLPEPVNPVPANPVAADLDLDDLPLSQLLAKDLIVETEKPMKEVKKKHVISEEEKRSQMLKKRPWLVPRISMYILEKDESKFKEFKGFEDLVTEDLSDDEIGGFRGFPDVVIPKKQKRKSKRMLELQAAELAEQLARTSPLLNDSQIRAAVEAEDNDSYAALEMLAGRPERDSPNPDVPEPDTPDLAAEAAARAESQLEMAKRVNAWHQSIRPKLAEAEERGHFDIHEYGSKILESFPQTSAKTTMSFQDLLKDVDTCDVPRFFLSALQLANTENVELATGDQLCMDQLELTLLSHTRHHEDLEEYVAPSREDGAEGPISATFHLAHPRKRK